MFVAIDGSTLLQSGVVTDMSRDGLHLRTRQPAPVGTIVEIEMEPRSGSPVSSPIITRGRVVRVQELPEGEYSVGVKLRYRAGRTNATRARTNPAPGEPLVTQPAHAKPKPVARKIDWRQWAVVSFFVFVIGLLLLWPRPGSPRDTVDGATRGSSSSLQEAIAETIKKGPMRSNNGPAHGNDQRGYSVLPLVPPTNAESKKPERISRLIGVRPDTIQNRATSGSMESVHYDRGEDQRVNRDATALNAEDGANGALLARAFGENKERRFTSGRRRANLARIEDNAQPIPAAVTGTNLIAFQSTRNDPIQSNEVLIVVDKGANTLTVFRGGKPYTRYPISIGVSDTTPTGTFTIHNKIRDPDWYHRGETVPHGDPRNPLGGFWMGFAKDGKPISYGIHATDDVGAIGQPTGRGCVRVKPAHADALFRICPAGATITIR